MPARGLTDRAILIGAGVAVLVFGVLGAIVAPPADGLDAGTSTFSAGPRGTKAAYLTLLQLGYRAERSIEPMTAVRVEPRDTTLILSGAEPTSEQDRRAIRAFVEQGGTLVAIGTNGGFALGLVAPPGPGGPLLGDVESVGRLIPSVLSSGAPQISMPAEVARPKFTAAYVPLYGPSVDDPVVAVASIGAGRAVWLADSTPLANAHLDAAHNLRFLQNVVGPVGRRVVFDEHYQGHKRSLWSYVVGTPLPWILAQAGLVLVAVLVTHSRRTGPVRPLHVDVRTSPMEFVEMLGGLYGRARARQAAVHAARTRLRRAIATSCGVPIATGDEMLARVAAARLQSEAGPIAELLAQAERAAVDPALDKEQALAITRRLQEYATRVQGVRGMRIEE